MIIIEQATVLKNPIGVSVTCFSMSGRSLVPYLLVAMATNTTLATTTSAIIIKL